MIAYWALGFLITAFAYSTTRFLIGSANVFFDDDYYAHHPHRLHPVDRHYETTIQEERL